MKLPDAIAGLNKEKLLEFGLRHGDKAVLAVLVLFSCGMAWGGIDSLRLKSVSPARLPKAIEQAASQAEGHINQLEKPPESVRVKAEPLAAKIDRWQAPKLAPATSTPLFDKPLFEELAKRTKPNVFPVEEPRAAAGIVVLAVKDAPASAAAPAAGERERSGEREKAGGGKRTAKRTEPNPADPFGGSGPAPRGAAAPPPGNAVGPSRGRIVPFVVVTAIVPHEKQVREYASRFSQTSYPDPKRDVPAWSEYVVERTEVRAGGKEKWEWIDQKMLAKKARDEWAGIQSENLPAGILMPTAGGAGQPVGPSFGTACLPLPQLAAGAWGPETMHPRFLELIEETWERRQQPPQSGQPSAVPGLEATEDQAPARPDFSPADEPVEGNQEPAAAAEARGGGPAADQPSAPPHRLFRIVDTTVKPGRTYRYRIRLSVWNPNWKLPARHLDDARIGENDRLWSADSEPTAAVQVPVPGAVLVRSLTKADTKKFKSGQFEVLALGESQKTGNFAFGSVITEVGGLVNVDDRLNKPGETRARGEPLKTECVVVDLHGRQQDRAEERASGRSPGPAEPFELLVLGPSGSFTVASVPDSQELIEQNIATLPLIETPVKPATNGSPASGPRGPSSPAAPF